MKDSNGGRMQNQCFAGLSGFLVGIPKTCALMQMTARPGYFRRPQ